MSGASAGGGILGGGGVAVDNSIAQTFTPVAGAVSGVAGGSSALSVSTLGNVTITQESPQAISGLADVAETALLAASQSSLGAFGLAKATTDKALDAALQGLQSPIQQAGKGIVVPVLIVIGVLGAIYLYKRNG
jgi:hypothetical protein